MKVEGSSLLQQHGAMDIRGHRSEGVALMEQGSEGSRGSIGDRPLPICARQGGIASAGGDAELLLCLGEAGKGCVVGLLALQGSSSLARRASTLSC